MTLNEALKHMSAQAEGAKTLTEADMPALHAALLDILADLKELCESYNIAWSLSAGNLLGAVRCGGFIPWDDDIDITMTREDFDRLAEVLRSPTQEKADERVKAFLEKYKFRIPGDPGYLLHFPRLYKRGTAFREMLSTDEGDNELYVDIFLHDGIPEAGIRRKLHGCHCNLLLGMISASRVYRCRETLTRYCREDAAAKKEVMRRIRIGRLLSFRSLEGLIRHADRVFGKYKGQKTKDIAIISGARHYFGEVYERDQVCVYRPARFEDRELPVPVGADYYLTRRYGSDYMTPPAAPDRDRRVLIDYRLQKVKEG